MEPFGTFYLDKEKDIIVDLSLENGELFYVLRTPNHTTGNLIRNLAKLCDLRLSKDDQDLLVIRGTVPSYFDTYNRLIYIFRLGNTKVANIYPDGRILNVRNDLQTPDEGLWNLLHPDGLPDSALGGVEHAAGAEGRRREEIVNLRARAVPHGRRFSLADHQEAAPAQHYS